MKTLSVIIPWCDRNELGLALKSNCDILSQRWIEVIIVNCGGRAQKLDKLLEFAEMDNLKTVRVPVDRFNKSLALNIGSFFASSEMLFFLDADIILRGKFLNSQALWRTTRKNFITIKTVVESHAIMRRARGLHGLTYSIKLTTARGKLARVNTAAVDFSQGTRSAPGLIMLRKDHFLRVNGMNSELNGWGWEDIDLVLRLQLMLNLHQNEIGSAIHLTHSDEYRNIVSEMRELNENKNAMICLANYHRGTFVGKYLADVRRWKNTLICSRRRRRGKQIIT